ncbi:MAG: PilZ domain-containing protein [Candidatus Hodarchaeales archaeon]|jgi:hypothetical protein
MQYREHKRFKTGSHCNIECAIAHNVKIKDISIGGICLETSRYIESKNIYDMKIVTKSNEETFLKGKVVWSSLRKSIKDKADIFPIFDIGLNFIEQNDNKNKFLENITKKLSH